MVAWYLLPLVLVIAVVYLVWAYRRKTIEKEAASRERFVQLLAAGAPDGEQRGHSAGAQINTGPVRPVETPEPGPEQGRFLGRAETLLYRLLKAGLSDHEIFAQVTLASVVGLPEGIQDYEREQRRRRLAQHRVDFLVCDKDMRIVAAVELDAGDADAPGADSFKADCLHAAGIRLVRVNRAAMPRREAVRALILGTDARPGLEHAGGATSGTASRGAGARARDAASE
ncbi:MAG: DUF2726 domain-containing protein [Betaproteobacteria bacterium]|nr:DUF2726 domain-containing protein [Betaproteobacteria bacterium]